MHEAAKPANPNQNLRVLASLRHERGPTEHHTDLFSISLTYGVLSAIRLAFFAHTHRVLRSYCQFTRVKRMESRSLCDAACVENCATAVTWNFIPDRYGWRTKTSSKFFVCPSFFHFHFVIVLSGEASVPTFYCLSFHWVSRTPTSPASQFLGSSSTSSQVHTSAPQGVPTYTDTWLVWSSLVWTLHPCLPCSCAFEIRQSVFLYMKVHLIFPLRSYFYYNSDRRIRNIRFSFGIRQFK